MLDDTKDKKWLVKHNNRIIGPFSEEELQTELAKDYISPFATVCVPEQPFWGYMAAYPEFIVHTDITKLTQFANTLHTNFTKTHKLISDHISSEYSQSEIDSATSTPPPSKSEDDHRVTENKTTLLEKQKKKINFFLVVFCMVIAGICAFVWHNNKESQLVTVPKNLHLGADWFSAGDYSKALQIWQNRKNQLSPADLVSFQVLKFQLKDDLSQGRELMRLKTAGNLNEETRNIIKALMQLKTGKQESGRQVLEELLNSQPSSDMEKVAFANLALLSGKKRDCDFFEKYKESRFGNKNLIHFVFALCVLQVDVSVEKRNKAQVLLESIIQNQGDYYQEALVGLAYIKYLKAEDVSSSITTLLDSNPYLTDAYRHNVFIDRKIYSWPELIPLCEKIYSSQAENMLFITFYAYCLVRSNHYKSAKELMAKTSLNPKDPLIKAVHAYIDDFLNFKNEYVLLLGDAIRSNAQAKYVLPHILQARFCEKHKDWDCAFHNWQIVLKNRPDSVSGLGGVAYAKYNQGLYEEAREYMTRGFVMDNTDLYSPLLFVQNGLEKVRQ